MHALVCCEGGRPVRSVEWRVSSFRDTCGTTRSEMQVLLSRGPSNGGCPSGARGDRTPDCLEVICYHSIGWREAASSGHHGRRICSTRAARDTGTIETTRRDMAAFVIMREYFCMSQCHRQSYQTHDSSTSLPNIPASITYISSRSAYISEAAPQ